jgi:hypothetical protein
MWWFGGIWCHKVLASNPLMNKSNDNVQTSTMAKDAIFHACPKEGI